MPGVNVKFYTLSKKDNSTKQPTGTALSANCYLKAPTNVLSPVITVAASNPSAYNYAYIADFGRYYWVEWTCDSQSHWTASLKVDALASWKTYIGATTAYVLRSSAAKNGTIVDGIYPVEAVTVTLEEAMTNPFAQTFKDGCFIIGIVNKGDSDLLGGITYYHMTADEFVAFADYLLSSNPLTTYMGDALTGLIGTMSLPDGEGGVFQSELDYDLSIKEDFVKSLVNPFQYVRSVKWFPVIPPGQLVGEPIRCGWWTMGQTIQGAPFDKYNQGMIQLPTITVDIPKHPQVARGTYLNLEPYSRYTLYAGPFGKIPLDSTLLTGGTQLRCDIYVDFITGEACLIVNRELSGFRPVAYVRSKIAIDMLLSQASTDISGAASGLLSGIVGAFTGNILGSASGISSAAEAMVPQSQSIGSVGSLVDFHVPMSLIGDFSFVADSNNSHRGSPLCEDRQISTIAGYIECQDGEVEFPGTESEIMTVKNYLEGGFFYE